MTERSIFIPGGHFEGVARSLAERLAQAEPGELVTMPLPPPPEPTLAHFGAAGLLLLGLVVLLFFIA